MTGCISRTVEGMDGSKNSGENNRLPPKCPGFKSRRRRHMWVEFFLVLFLAPRGFFPGTPVPLLLKNQHFQIPIRPGIRQTKNHLADVLPINCCLLFIILYNS